MCGAPPPQPRPTDQAYVWDLPTRLFHWALVVCVVGAFITAKLGGNWMVWHGRFGITALGLLAFRLVWGFIGPTYARFAQFVRGPRTILAYLKGQWHGQGHNPLGALSVLALLGILVFQGAIGLFSNDDVAFEGYLMPLVGAELSNRLTSLHKITEEILLLLVALHVGAIAFYAWVKKENLVQPMITGWAPGKPSESTRGGGAKAFLTALGFALAIAYAASGVWLPAPPPPAPAPDW